MRITGGIYKGRKIKCPKGIIRPAMDRMRESLFAILGDLSGYSFLDLFSGSGVIGIEAASRGAEPVALVEKDAKKIKTIKLNISFVNIKIKVYLTSVELYIKRYQEKSDYIFIDPPFAFKNKILIVNLLLHNELFSGKGYIMIHLPSKEVFPSQILNLKQFDKRIYGGSSIIFYRLI